MVMSRGLGDVYKRQPSPSPALSFPQPCSVLPPALLCPFPSPALSFPQPCSVLTPALPCPSPSSAMSFPKPCCVLPQPCPIVRICCVLLLGHGYPAVIVRPWLPFPLPPYCQLPCFRDLCCMRSAQACLALRSLNNALATLVAWPFCLVFFFPVLLALSSALSILLPCPLPCPLTCPVHRPASEPYPIHV